VVDHAPAISRDAGVSRTVSARLYGLLACVVVTACAAGADGSRYTMAELQDGVGLDVEDETGTISNAELIDPGALRSYESIMPALADGQTVVLTSGDPNFDPALGRDFILVYRVGGFCGLAPDVKATGHGDTLSISIHLSSDGDCDAMEYDEAVAFSIRDDQMPTHIDAAII
jgi:hypothetical protein